MARNVGLQVLAKRYGLAKSSLHRHKQAMRERTPQVFASLAAADWGVTTEELEKLKLETADGWIKILRSQCDKLIRAQDGALEDDKLGLAATLAGRVHEALAMLGKSTDNLRDHSTATVQHLHYSPQFVDFRSKVIHALRGFPEARAHLLACLREDAETEAGSQDNAPVLALEAA